MARKPAAEARGAERLRTRDRSGMQCAALHESEEPGADPVPTFLVGTGEGMAPNPYKNQNNQLKIITNE